MALESKEVNDIIDTMAQAYLPQLQTLTKFQEIGAQYFNGNHWARQSSGRRIGRSAIDASSPLQLNYSPESTQLRVIENFITSNTQLAESSTHPLQLPINITPPRRDITTESSRLASVCEWIMEMESQSMRSLAAAAYSNFMAAIVGSWLIVVDLHRFQVEREGQPTIGEWRVKWRTSPSTNLILDPGNPDPDLRNHDVIILRRIMSLKKIQATYGIEIPKDKASTVGELVQKIFADGSRHMGMYGDYVHFSKTPAAITYQVHKKSDETSERFDEMAIMVDSPEQAKGRIMVNDENPISPYGGDGLPMAVINYYQRPGHALGQGATHQMIPDQDLANFHASVYARGMAYSSVPQWLIDQRGIKDKEKFQRMVSNRIGGVIFYPGRDKNSGYHPPVSIRSADPNPAHLERLRDLPANARNKVHRSRMNQGDVKSHVADVTAARALDETDKVPNIIVESHIKVLQKLMVLSLGTLRLGVAAGSPKLLQRWNKRGFGVDELIVFNRLDPLEPNVEIRIPREAIRPRSPLTKRNEIMQAAALPVPPLSKAEVKRGLTVDAEIPLTSHDEKMIKFIQGEIDRLIAGNEWEPLPGDPDFHDQVILELQDALYSTKDDAARRSIRRAIETQKRLQADELRELQAIQQGQQAEATQQTGGLDVSSLVAS